MGDAMNASILGCDTTVVSLFYVYAKAPSFVAAWRCSVGVVKATLNVCMWVVCM